MASSRSLWWCDRPLETHFDDNTRSAFLIKVGRIFGRLSSFVLFPVLLATALGVIYHRGVDIGALAVGSYGQILTVKIMLALVNFGLAAVHGVMSGRAAPGIARTLGITGGVVSATVVLLATALLP